MRLGRFRILPPGSRLPTTYSIANSNWQLSARSRSSARLPGSCLQSSKRSIRRFCGVRSLPNETCWPPIAFDGFGTLEVDLLCADARLAVELDGTQHLADPVAYRRDRRKDQLLQENGYLVLRFLAEDVGRDLDLVLDAILRTLSSRQARLSPTSPLHFVRQK